MTQVKEVTLYQYDELPTEEAKEEALNWFLEGLYHEQWWESKGRKVNELRPFRSERDGKIWNEFAFQYTPFWERKAAIYSD